MSNDRQIKLGDLDWNILDNIVATIIEDRITRKSLEITNSIVNDVKEIITNVSHSQQL